MSNLKKLVKILGLSALAGAVLIMIEILYKIHRDGQFIGVEPNKYILYSELAFMIFGALFLLWLFKYHVFTK